MLAAVVATSGAAGQEQGGAPFAFGGGVVESGELRVTVFASGLPYPNGMAELPDGSLLVAVSVPTEGGYFSSVGELVRLVDDDGDGVADEPPVTVASGLPGALGSLRVAGDLVFVANAAYGDARISVFRLGETAEAPLVPLGAISFTYPTAMDHGTYGLAVGESVEEAGGYDLYFNVGSISNEAAGGVVDVSGLTNGTLADAAIYRVRVDDRGATPVFSAPEAIASGLRNAAGIALDPRSGDLLFEDNGIDTPENRIEALSADELNVLPAGEIGGEVEDFGFPSSYVAYRTGERVGSEGRWPAAAFLPLAGVENEGAAEIAVAPAGFPDGLNAGVFVGFHGQWDEVGLANEENPVAYVDLESGEQVHVVGDEEPGVGHLDGLLATEDALFLADLTGTGSLVGYEATGAIYRVAVS